MFVDALLVVAEARAAVALPSPQGFEPAADPFAHLAPVPAATAPAPGSGGDVAMADAEGATAAPSAAATAPTSTAAAAQAADKAQAPGATSAADTAPSGQPSGEVVSRPSSQELPSGGAQQAAGGRVGADGSYGMAALAGQGFGQGFGAADGPPPYPAVLAEVVSRVLHCCYSELWQTRMGAVQALQLLIGKCARSCPLCIAYELLHTHKLLAM